MICHYHGNFQGEESWEVSVRCWVWGGLGHFVDVIAAGSEN